MRSRDRTFWLGQQFDQTLDHMEKTASRTSETQSNTEQADNTKSNRVPFFNIGRCGYTWRAAFGLGDAGASSAARAILGAKPASAAAVTSAHLSAQLPASLSAPPSARRILTDFISIGSIGLSSCVGTLKKCYGARA